MSKEVPWTKVIMETFISDACLTKEEEIVLRTRCTGWTRVKQADELARDYDYIANQIGLIEKVREGDEIAEALMSHLTYQMSELNKRYAEV